MFEVSDLFVLLVLARAFRICFVVELFGLFAVWCFVDLFGFVFMVV